MEEQIEANPGYALGRLRKALETAQNHPDPSTRERAQKKVERWLSVLEKMAKGEVKVGSRTPLEGTPSWVTLEVAHGGFATGNYLAEGPLLAHERALLAEVPGRVPGSSERARLNHYFLSDSGQHRLSEAVDSGKYSVEIPEEGALPVVVWLLDNGLVVEALELISQLQPFVGRLRFYPRLREDPAPPGDLVRLEMVGQVTQKFSSLRPQPRVQAMNEALSTWNPLLDQLVELWVETIDGELPRLGKSQVLEGGWPGSHWPEDWDERRASWLKRYRKAATKNQLCGKHRHPKSNFSRLREALELSRQRPLSRRELGWVRRALANTITRYGAPGSPQREELRNRQRSQAELPTRPQLASVVVSRLQQYPGKGGLTSLEPILAEVGKDESDELPEGTALPEEFEKKLARALEATVEELVQLGVLSSAEVLAGFCLRSLRRSPLPGFGSQS